MLLTQQFSLFYFFNEVLTIFICIFQSKFLSYDFFCHIFKVIINFSLKQQFSFDSSKNSFSNSLPDLLEIIEGTNNVFFLLNI